MLFILYTICRILDPMSITDLTHTFSDKFPVFPGDPRPKFELLYELDDKGFDVSYVQFGVHNGTHIDAPSHLLKGGRKIHEFDPAQFIGEGVLVDGRDREILDADSLKDIKIPRGAIVLFWTGHDRYLQMAGREYFDEFPKFTVELALKLAEAGAKMIGMDTPSPDLDPYEVHKILLKNNCLIIENLTNLEALSGRKFTVFALPMKFPAEGAPARVIAVAD